MEIAAAAAAAADHHDGSQTASELNQTKNLHGFEFSR